MKRKLIGLALATAFSTQVVVVSAGAAALENEALTLNDFVNRVFSYNEAVQIRILEAEISRKRYQTEKGIFEPQFFATGEAVDRQRANTQEQTLNLGGFTRVFNERNQNFNTGIDMLTPLGSRVRLSYGMARFNNNLNAGTALNGEFVSQAGLSITQPLLRGAWPKAVFANIRAAAIESEVSFQDYRRGLIQIIGQAETAYWDLYMAQEQHTIAQESVKLAQTILKDNKARAEVGKASELEVLQADAGLAEREVIEREASQRVHEAANTAMGLYSESVMSEGAKRLKAADAPQLVQVTPNLDAYRFKAYQANPDYVGATKQAGVNEIRLDQAKNARLPQLDLIGGYSVTSLDNSPGGAHSQLLDQNFPSWSIGFEFRVPLGGGKGTKRAVEGAKLRAKSGELALQAIRVRLENALDSAIRNIRIYSDSSRRLDKVVEFNENLLETQLARLDVGKVDSRTVLETERELFQAKIARVESLIRFQRALMALEVVAGTILEARNLEVTQEELSIRTAKLVDGSNIDEAAYADFVAEMKKQYEAKRGYGNSPSDRVPSAQP